MAPEFAGKLARILTEEREGNQTEEVIAALDTLVDLGLLKKSAVDPETGRRPWNVPAESQATYQACLPFGSDNEPTIVQVLNSGHMRFHPNAIGALQAAVCYKEAAMATILAMVGD